MKKTFVYVGVGTLFFLIIFCSPVFAQIVPNLIANPSLETADTNNNSLPQNWLQGNWGTNTAVFSFLSTGHTGSRSGQVQITSYVDGDAKWYFTPITVQSNTKYTFSDFYKSTAPTKIVAQFDDGSGNLNYQDLVTTVPASSVWAQSKIDFTTPANAKIVTIFHLINSVGILTTDDFSLIPATTSGLTLIPNPSVEIVNPSDSTLPQDWQHTAWGTNTSTFSYPNTGHTGNRSVKVQMTSYTDGDAKWYSNPVPVQSDTQYTFSDYYQATVATEVDAAFTMSDGTTIYQIIGLPEPSSTWVNFTTQFSIPLGAQNVTIYHLIHQIGTLTIDDENLQTYTPVGFNRALLSLTFDGGYESTYTAGLPRLTKNGFISTQYIVTNLLDTAGFMKSQEVKDLATAGHEIASHTVTHNNMLTETPSQWTTELKDSQTTLKNLIGSPITDFAFPNGLYNSGIMTATKRSYGSARGVEDALNSKDNFNVYDIKVQNIFSNTTPDQVADWVKQAQNTNTWLVLVYHSVDQSSLSIYNTIPTNLDLDLSAIKSSGITVLPVSQALSELLPQMGL